jgi:RNA polymerase sigma-70 factor (ECF subfamily)
VGRLDEAAFAAFHARSAPALRAYVYRVVGHAADADDIVQEAFLRMLRADLETGDEDQWRRYLYRIASNLIVDGWRRRKFEQQDSPAMREPASRTPHYEDDVTVARIFSELKPRERALLWLAYVERESHEEIASSLGIGRRSVRVMLFRARRRLRDLLQARGMVVNG